MPAVCDDPDTWHRMTPELSYPPQSTSMVLSDAQLPMVCYKPTYWQGCSLLFAEYDGTEWSESEVDCQQYSGSGSRLFLSPDGEPSILYGASYYDEYRYAMRTLSGWSTEVITWEGSCGHGPSIELDALGKPWMFHSRFDSCEVVWWGEDTSAVAHRQSPVIPAGGISGIAPNPMSSGGMVHLAIPKSGRYTMTLYDLSGRVAARPLDSVLDAGSLPVAVDASSLPAGTYIAALQGGGRRWCSRMVVLR